MLAIYHLISDELVGTHHVATWLEAFTYGVSRMNILQELNTTTEVSFYVIGNGGAKNKIMYFRGNREGDWREINKEDIPEILRMHLLLGGV